MGRGVGGDSPAVAKLMTTVEHELEALKRGGGGGDGSEALRFGDKLCTRTCTRGKRGKRSNDDDVIITLPFTLCSENNGVEIPRAMHASLRAVQSPSKRPPPKTNSLSAGAAPSRIAFASASNPRVPILLPLKLSVSTCFRSGSTSANASASASFHSRISNSRTRALPSAAQSVLAYKSATTSQSAPLVKTLRDSSAANLRGCIGGAR